ncbi:MAG: hypothetical protein IJU40_00310, partial [Desulfovibrionaceae bacterium]|nr:hypothetical protein [Desulfovibrionaceae bacterium]
IYHGNVKSKIYHKKICKYYNSKDSTAVFYTKQSAEDAGFRPCKICFSTKKGSISSAFDKLTKVFDTK